MLERHKSERPEKGTGLLFFEEPKTEKKPSRETNHTKFKFLFPRR